MNNDDHMIKDQPAGLIDGNPGSRKRLRCSLEDWGLIDYPEAYTLQKRFVEEVLRGGPSRLILCEHRTVLTMGRMAKGKHILLPSETLDKNEVHVHYIDRGGDITLHAPGQLVVYPILNLSEYKKDLHFYLQTLEQVVIDLLNGFDILATRFSGHTGVWAGEKKIASIGVGVKKWITFHGLAVNVNTDLKLFSMIKPCGLDVSMTSLAEQKGQLIDMNTVKQKIVECFFKNFELEYSPRQEQ